MSVLFGACVLLCCVDVRVVIMTVRVYVVLWKEYSCVRFLVIRIRFEHSDSFDNTHKSNDEMQKTAVRHHDHLTKYAIAQRTRSVAIG